MMMEPKEFKFIALSDTHITATRSSLQGTVSDNIVDAIIKYHKDAKFVVNCGDLSNNNYRSIGGKKRESYIYNDIWYTKAQQINLPCYYDGFGNHDVWVGRASIGNNDDMRVFLTKKNKKRLEEGKIVALCKENMNYEWQIKVGDITFHFIMLNLFPKAPVVKNEQESIEKPDEGNRTDYGSFAFLKKRLRLLDGKDLSKHPVFLFHHYGFLFTSYKALYQNHWTEKEIGTYINYIKKYNIALITYGHLHGTGMYYLNDYYREKFNNKEKYNFETSYDTMLKNTGYYKDVNGRNQKGINTLLCGGTFQCKPSARDERKQKTDSFNNGIAMGLSFEDLERIPKYSVFGSYVVCSVKINSTNPVEIKLECAAKVLDDNKNENDIPSYFAKYDISWPRRW